MLMKHKSKNGWIIAEDRTVTRTGSLKQTTNWLFYTMHIVGKEREKLP